jgi:hypothetical protein
MIVCTVDFKCQYFNLRELPWWNNEYHACLEFDRSLVQSQIKAKSIEIGFCCFLDHGFNTCSDQIKALDFVAS